MINIYKHIHGAHMKERKEKNKTGARSNSCKPAMDKFTLEIKRLLTIRGVKFRNGFPSKVGRNLNYFKTELDTFLERMV